MRNILLLFFLSIALFSIPVMNFGQTPTLGSAADFVLFSTNGAVSNTGISHITGNVGTNNGSSTAFGNVDGVMHDHDATTTKVAADLLLAYNQLNSAIPNFFPSSLLGNGATLIAGVYSIPSAATLNLDLTLDAKGNSNAVFIFQIQGAFSTNATSNIKLINGALACNVFWKVEGLVDMAAGTIMRGTVIANNAAIIIKEGSTLEGRALSTAGAITVNGVLAYTPVGCSSTVLTGPVAPDLGSTQCYALFSSDGQVTNTGSTTITGDVGTNVGITTGFNQLQVSGTIHPIPDASTAKCAADLDKVYKYLDNLPYDIELLYPAQFGGNLVLTPHTYLMNAAAVLTGTVYLNAQNNPNAVFVIQINGALLTSTYSNVILLNGAQAKNVFWKIEGAVSINNYSRFTGSIICHDGAFGTFNTGVSLDGRVLATSGSITTNAVMTTMVSTCTPSSIVPVNGRNIAITIYPNPFTTSINILINDITQISNCEVLIYNILGVQVSHRLITQPSTTIGTGNLPSGVYFYKVSSNNKTLQTGKLISNRYM
jgi:formylmethanofuran dehydrogenase subunit C